MSIGKTVAIKLFQDGTGGLGNNIIKGGTIAATDVDTEKPIPLRLEVTEEKELIIQVAGQTAEYTLPKTSPPLIWAATLD